MTSLARLTRTDGGGRDPDGGQQVVMLDQAVGLGRSEARHEYDDGREIPPVFKDIRMLIRVENPENHVSRNHAAILAPNVEGGRFRIVDLDSKNGTSVNGVRIVDGIETELPEGCEVQLAGDVKFRFSERDVVSGQNYALMIGHGGGNLRGHRNDVPELSELLRERGFENIVTLLDDEATRGNIANRVSVAKRHVTADGLFVFYFCGHGRENGALVVGDEIRGGAELEAEELFKLLEGFRGKILMILDGCYTSVLGEHKDFPNRAALIGHVGKGYEGRAASVMIEGGGRYDEVVRHFTSRALCKVLRRNCHRIDADDLVDMVQKEVGRSDNLKVRKTRLGLHRNGETHIKLPSIRVDAVKFEKGH